MKIMIITQSGEGLGLGVKLSAQKHKVLLITTNKDTASVGLGIIEKLHRPMFTSGLAKQEVKKFKPDLVIIDAPGFSPIGEQLRINTSTKVLGTSYWTDNISMFQGYFSAVRGSLGLGSTEQDKKATSYLEFYFDGNEARIPCKKERYDKFLAGDLGIDCVMGSYLSPIHNISPSLKPLINQLKRCSYFGFITLGMCEGKVVSFYAGIDYSSLYCYGELLFNDYYNLFTNPPKDIFRHVALSVAVSTSPYPYANIPIHSVGIKDEVSKHLGLAGLSKEQGVFFSTSACLPLLYVTARGINLKEARRRCYRTIESLEVQDIQYRIDLGR